MSNNSCLTIPFCVPPGYQFLIAELHYEGEHFGELNTENGRLELVQFPRPSGKPWTIPLKHAIDGLREAEEQLISRSTFFSS